MITFTEAATVAAGEQITSRQINTQARAFIDRMLSGVGNCVERVIFFAWALGRQIRNPTGAGEGFIGQWPYADEWLRIYAYLNPRVSGSRFPLAAPGEEEGINLANPLGAFQFGNAAADMTSEGDRLSEDVGSVPLWADFGDGMREPQTPWECWLMAQQQRGGVDPTSGVMGAPAITVAQEHYKLKYAWWSKYLASYGGLLPTARRCEAGCGDVMYYDDYGAEVQTPRYEIIFTPTAYGLSLGRTVKRYSGFCPPNSPGAADDCYEPATAISGISTTEWFHKVYQWVADGANWKHQLLEELAVTEYIQGPYTGGGQMGLDSRGGRHLNLLMNWFVHDFRGDQDQLAGQSYDADATSFANEKFFGQQYLLSPARGTLVGDEVQVTYPRFTWDASAVAGTAGLLPGDVEIHEVADGFVFACGAVKAELLQVPVTIKLTDSDTGQTLQELTLTPDESGGASAFFNTGTSARKVNIAAQLVTDLSLDTGGALYCEIGELWAWKPTIPDAYVYLRLSSTIGGSFVSLDTDGIDLANPVDIWTNYNTKGCIFNPGAAGISSIDYISEGPIYEAGRRLFVENIRMASEAQVTGYAVEDGRSIIYFKRYAVLSNEEFDIFNKIAPSKTAIEHGRLLIGETYLVTGGVEVQHNGQVVPADSSFQAVTTDWEATESSTGAEQVWETSAIRRTAPPTSETNRWCVYSVFNAGRDGAPSSVWKEELYNNTIVYHNRCHTMSNEIRDSYDLNMHFTLGQNLAMISEALPAYNYVRGINSGISLTPEARIEKFKSCPIFKAPLEILSVTDEDATTVKVTLNGRLQHCDESPAAIENDPINWTWLNSGAPVLHRTDENALCEWLRYRAGGPECKSTSEPFADNLDPESGQPSGFAWQIGDMADPNELDRFGSDTPYGACIPRIYLVRLPVEVYEDSPENAVPDASDTKRWMDTMAHREMLLRAFAGGWVDSRSSVAAACDGGHLYNYTVENLFYEAFGGTSIPLMNIARGPNPSGAHGPLPACSMDVEPFNAISQSVNLLKRFAVLLPLSAQSRTTIDTGGRVAVGPDLYQFASTAGPYVGDEIVETANNALWWESVDGVTESGWYDTCTTTPENCEWEAGFARASGRRSANPSLDSQSAPTGITMLWGGSSYQYAVEGRYTAGAVRIDPTLPVLWAIPESLRDQFVSQPGFLARKTIYTTIHQRDNETGTPVTACGDPGAELPDSWSDGTHSETVNFRQVEVTNSSECVLFGGGAVTVPDLPGTAMYYHHPNSVDTCVGGAVCIVELEPIDENDFFIEIPLTKPYP